MHDSLHPLKSQNCRCLVHAFLPKSVFPHSIVRAEPSESFGRSIFCGLPFDAFYRCGRILLASNPDAHQVNVFGEKTSADNRGT